MFSLSNNFQPAGDQPEAIKSLIEGVKKGYKKQTLLGATATGKSVSAETEVLIRIKDKIYKTNIGSFVDSQMFKHGYKQVGKDTDLLEGIDLNDFETLSFNPGDGNVGWNKINQLTRHKAPEEMFTLRLSCGREVDVTGDHSIYILRNGRMQLIPSCDIRVGDFIPVPRSIPHSNEITKINLYDYINTKKVFVSVPTFNEIYNFKSNDIFSFITKDKVWRVSNNGERITYSSYKGLSNFYPDIQKDAAITWVRSEILLPETLELTPSFLRLVGYYIGEGHSEKRYFSLSNSDEEIINDFSLALKSIGLEAKKRRHSKYDYQISSCAWSECLSTMCGSHSHNKKLPLFWMQLSNENLASILSAYFSADGTVEKTGVSVTTKSKSLANDVMYALLRFSIVARSRERLVKIPGKDNIRSKVWVVSITGGANVKAFNDNINFTLSYKREKLKKLLQKKEDTNVDSAPIDLDSIGNLRKILNLSKAKFAEQTGISRSYIQLLERKIRMPSQKVLRKIINAFENERNEEIQKILDQYKILNKLFWSPISTIEKKVGIGYVYDFSVPGDETFLAGFGGLFVHNTFTVANVIATVQKPTLVIAHNKTLAAQLASEFEEFFPNNAVHYFVSYYDYYQPEAYMPVTDTFIEKDAQINKEIDRLRHATTQSLLTRDDVIIVASVSCIYGLGSPEEYEKRNFKIEKGMNISRTDAMSRLISIHFERTNADLAPGLFRALGNKVEVMPISDTVQYAIEFSGNVITSILKIDPVSSRILSEEETVFIFPAKHFITNDEQKERALKAIKLELDEQLQKFEAEGKLLEAERIKRRTNYDLAMIREMGYCSGIENYSRHLSGKEPGEPPETLLSYFPHKKDGSPDFLTIIDESHVTLPQLNGMYAGDASRKNTLVEFGFRLPSAKDNRPLKFPEFEQRIGQVIYTSATPSAFEREHSEQIVEQIIRPTGLVDPLVEVRPIMENGSYPGQVHDFIQEAEKEISQGRRVLATTLTKRMAEDLTEYLKEKKVKAGYIHSDVKTIDRIRIITNFRKGEFDILVGVNLLREGLDMPEVSLIGILDADKEGFLRSEVSLIQTIGRAARNSNGRVILYADHITGSMERAMLETSRRREKQLAYNKKHGITPKTIEKKIKDITEGMESEHDKAVSRELALDMELFAAAEAVGKGKKGRGKKNPIEKLIALKEAEMKESVKLLDFETAAILRDEIKVLKEKTYINE